MKNNKDYALQALSLMDLTSLNDEDTEQTIKGLCAKELDIKRIIAFGHTAAICIYPQFVQTAKQFFIDNGIEDVKIATVTNFPHGNDDVAIAVAETKSAVANGADEVDVVFPYRAFMNGNEAVGAELVNQCKIVCQSAGVILKVIIETGELKTPELIRHASDIAIASGADFIKTSTGKVAINATLKSAEIMLNAIKYAKQTTGRNIGFKAAGGVRTVEDAIEYLQLAENIMGAEWITADTFRFGASGLLSSLLDTLEGKEMKENTASY